MQGEVLVAACILAVVAMCCLAVVVSVLLVRTNDAFRLLSQQQKSGVAMTEKLMELSQVDYVAQHLRRYGVGGYLVTANEKIAEDVDAIMKWLGLSEDEAIEYLKSGVRSGLQPRKPVANGRALDGDEPERPRFS